MASRLFFTLALFGAAAAHSSGIDSCTDSPGHGSSASTFNDNGVSISLLDVSSGMPTSVTSYTPGNTYTLQLQRDASSGSFRGFVAGAFGGSSYSSGFSSSGMIGSLPAITFARLALLPVT